MSEPAETNEWNDPARPPVAATDLGSGVWASWGTEWDEVGDHPTLWHWCSQENWRRQGRPMIDGPRWALAGCKKHDLISSDPLHLEPSVYWPDCCGMHGFIRNGTWQGV